MYATGLTASGDVIKLDAPLVSMETAKAVVEVPSPVSGKVLKLAGGAGRDCDSESTDAIAGEPAPTGAVFCRPLMIEDRTGQNIPQPD